MVLPNWAGLGVVPAFSFCRPPRSVLGHGLGIGRLNWGRGLSIFCDRLSFVLPTPSSAPSRGGGQGNLATHTVAQDCVSFCFIFFVIHVIFSSLCNAFSARHFTPSRDAGCSTFPSRVGFHLSLSRPPATLAVRGRVLTLVSLIMAPAFSFDHLSPSRPPARMAVRGRVLMVVYLTVAPAFPFNCFFAFFLAS